MLSDKVLRYKDDAFIQQKALASIARYNDVISRNVGGVATDLGYVNTAIKGIVTDYNQQLEDMKVRFNTVNEQLAKEILKIINSGNPEQIDFITSRFIDPRYPIKENTVEGIKKKLSVNHETSEEGLPPEIQNALKAFKEVYQDDINQKSVLAKRYIEEVFKVNDTPTKTGLITQENYIVMFIYLKKTYCH